MLGQRIAELRVGRGWSQTDLAKRLKVSSKAVRNWEDDISDPSAEHIIEIANLFEITTDYLLGIDSSGVINIGLLPPSHQKRLRLICQAYISVPDE